ncbi:MAG: type II toxin-antitoxin system PemK/MazF family toxin [Acidobacteriia bacterium]|nr:type II toxin-antitoxin system PemK/MazF family toxin [Terriglobia bacterium]
MTLQAGEVVLIRMQFHQAAGAKIRPALVLFDPGDDDFVAAPITSQPRSSQYDLTLQDWQSAGLNVPSFTRVHKLTVLSKSDIARNLGRLSDRDRESLLAILCRAFCPKP